MKNEECQVARTARLAKVAGEACKIRQMKHSVIVIAIVVALCGSTSPAFANAHMPGQGERQAVPPGWSEAMRQSLDLTVAGKHTETIVMFEKWVAKYPNFFEARMMLGGAHEKIDPKHADALREKTRILEEQARQNRIRKPGE